MSSATQVSLPLLILEGAVSGVWIRRVREVDVSNLCQIRYRRLLILKGVSIEIQRVTTLQIAFM